MKTINILFISLAILFSVNSYAKDLSKGQITGNLEQKVKILPGDRATTNLGKKNGVIKGDILSIYKPNDTEYVNSIGKCAVISVFDSTSICEITRIDGTEVGKDTVVIDKLMSDDANLYQAIFQLLTKAVEPYEPYKEITVYVNGIYDEQNNITKFSEKVEKEIKKIFFQKKRMVKFKGNISQGLLAYLPGEYAESNAIIEEYLKKDNIDVLIAGTYSKKGDKIELSLYKIDRNYEDLVVDTALGAPVYADITSSVVTPYKQVKKEKKIAGEVLYNPVHHKITARDERNNIILLESRRDPFLEFSLNRTIFNIISPVEFKLNVDNNEIDFEKTNVQQISMTTGKHEISARFKKGFYYNDSLLLINNDEVRKNIVLILDNADDIKIEVIANPVPGNENIDFKIYKKSDRSRPDFKPVLPQKNGIKIVETFKD